MISVLHPQTIHTIECLQHSGSSDQQHGLGERGHLLQMVNKSASWLVPRPLSMMDLAQPSASCWTSKFPRGYYLHQLLLSNLGCWLKWPMTLLVTPSKSWVFHNCHSIKPVSCYNHQICYKHVKLSACLYFFVMRS